MSFNLVRLYIYLQLEDPIEDPYVLFGIKGRFGAALRRVIGCRRVGCESCDNSLCPGFVAFSQQLAVDPMALRRFQKPSSPFIFDMPVIPPLPNESVVCTVGLTLLGPAVMHWQIYVDAVKLLVSGADTLGFNLPLKVIGVDTAGFGADRSAIGTDASAGPVILSDEGLLRQRHLSSTEISIRFLTPLRLLSGGTPLHVMQPSQFLRALMRRVSSLAYYYGAQELDCDFKWLAQEALNIRLISATFGWIRWTDSLVGLLGNGTLVGNISDFHYFLVMGEYFNVGKGATFGYGRFVIE